MRPDERRQPPEPMRCPWAGDDPLMIHYRDQEWGTPTHDDREWLEMLILEGFQAGLSWRTVLHKRAAFRHAFGSFRPDRVAHFGPDDVEASLANPGIIRNRAKMKAAITNARAFREIQTVEGSFDDYAWRFVDGAPIVNRWTHTADVPSETDVSRAMSRDLKARGFRFVGPTICYALMQATGLVNDHLVQCFRHPDQGDPSAPSAGNDRHA